MNTNITLYLILFWHLLYDWHLQGQFVAEWKSKSLFVLFIHSLTWAMGIGIILYTGAAFAWWKIIMLLTTHMIVDDWKCRYATDIKNSWTLYVDQASHLLTILWAVYK